jgi:uncharacterized membrane protein
MRAAGRVADGERPPRRHYLDWLRGVAVLIMIEAHLLDSWCGGPDRQTRAFGIALVFGGIGGPLFLLLAGVAVSLSAAAKLRRTENVSTAAAAVVRRGLQIYALAFLFRIQAWILGWSSPRALLKVDILNIMGPSIAAAAALWGSVKSLRGRLLAFACMTVGIALTTPIIRNAPIDPLPDAIEAYIRPVANLSNFVLFPSAGFVFAGAIAGLLIDATARSREARLNAWLFFGGAAVAGAAFAASYLPSPYPRSSFWTTSPCYFFVQAGLSTAAIGAAYAWQARPGGVERWSPLRQLGRTSLFIYWIHVDMLYGLISVPLHKALTLREGLVAFVLFSLFMLVCSIAKDWVVAWWYAQRAPGGEQSPVSPG